MAFPSKCFQQMFLRRVMSNVRHRRISSEIRSTSSPSSDSTRLYIPLSERLQSVLDSGESETHTTAKRCALLFCKAFKEFCAWRLFLVDAMHPITRVHYAVKERLTSSSGLDTTILFGFMKHLLAVLTTRPFPSYCVVVFDAEGADFRKSIFPGYKAHRVETPTEVIDSIPMIQKALDCLGIKWIRAHAVEADDVIGTLAYRFANDIVNAYIFSRDKVSIAICHVIKIPVFVFRISFRF